MRWDAVLGGFVPNTQKPAVAAQSQTAVGGVAPKQYLTTPQQSSAPSSSATTPVSTTGAPASVGGFQAPQFDDQIRQLVSALSLSTPPPSATDPNISDVLAQLRATTTTPSRASATLAPLAEPYNIAAPDFSGINSKADEIKNLLTALREGKGLDVGDISTDPAAAAYRVAQRRNAEQQRASEADRLAASGVTGSGDFDSRVAGINEDAGTSIANFEGNLANARRGEKLATGLTTAQMGLSDLSRMQQAEQAKFDSQVGLEGARRAGVTALADAQSREEAQKVSELTALLNALLTSSQSARSAQSTTQASQLELLRTLLASRN